MGLPQVPRDLGSGKFDLLANIRALPTHQTIPMYWTAVALMGALQLMHTIWYLLILNIGRKIVLGKDPSAAGDEEYEGDQYADRTPKDAGAAKKRAGQPVRKLFQACLLCALAAGYFIPSSVPSYDLASSTSSPARAWWGQLSGRMQGKHNMKAKPAFTLDSLYPVLHTPRCGYYNLTTAWDPPLWEHLHPSLPVACDPKAEVEACRDPGVAFDGAWWTRWTSHNWQIPIAASIIYLVGIAVVERMMRNRERLTLRSLVIPWNFGLSAFSAAGTVVCVPHLLFGAEGGLLTRGFYHSVCVHASEYGCSWVGLFVMAFVYSKLLELFDTLWLRLRKSPVIFLHWYELQTYS